MSVRGDGDATDPGRGLRRRGRRPWVPLGLLVLLFVAIVLVPRRSPVSRTVPPGRFGAAIRCLQRNGSFRVVTFGTSAAPDRATRTIAIEANRLGHRTLAEMREASSAGVARSIVARNRFGELDGRDYRVDGRIVWGYDRNGDPPRYVANAGERTLVGACVRTPRP